MAGRPKGAENKDKPFRDALRMEVVQAGDDRLRLRKIANALLDQAEAGNVHAIREVADRLDGKVPQAIGGSDELPPLQTEDVSDTDLARRIAFLLTRAAKKQD